MEFFENGQVTPTTATRPRSCKRSYEAQKNCCSAKSRYCQLQPEWHGFALHSHPHSVDGLPALF